MSSIINFISGLDGQQKAIVSYLHQRLAEHHGLVQHIKYEIPMYYRKSWVCYLNPIKNEGIELAFLNGHKLSNDQGILDRKKRKMVAGIDLYHVSKIPERQIDEIVQEAIILDDLAKSKR
ncbi:DUF1801 domain-containing protein [Ekhidna sp.]|uniref:DUF1801 domain-containing protein n=1 Tax=Ekhidna sp. TaxID=2608089 RepID=UPI0032EF49EA